MEDSYRTENPSLSPTPTVNHAGLPKVQYHTCQAESPSPSLILERKHEPDSTLRKYYGGGHPALIILRELLPFLRFYRLGNIYYPLAELRQRMLAPADGLVVFVVNVL